MGYGIRKIDERLISPGRSLVLNTLKDSIINIDDVPPGTLYVDPKTGTIKYKNENNTFNTIKTGGGNIIESKTEPKNPQEGTIWIDTSEDEDDIKSTMLFGSGKFNGKEGQTIKHSANVDSYIVIISPLSSDGDIGEYSVCNKTKNSFSVINTGENKKSSFDWILIKKQEDNKSFMTGISYFNFEDGTTITHNIGNKNYYFLLTPIGIPNGSIGEYSVIKNENNCIVKSTGKIIDDSQNIGFNWIIIK